VITRLRYKAEGLGFLDLREHIWVCDAETGEGQQLTGGEFDDGDPAWSPDGGWIAFLSNRSDDPDMHPHKTNLWLIPATGGASVEIPLPFGHKRNLSWSPDGQYIAYIGCETTEDPWTAHNDRLWVIPVSPPTAGTARCLTAGLDRFVGLATIADVGLTAETAQNPIWLGDGSRLFFLLSDRGNTHVYTVGLDDGTEPEAVVSGTLNVQSFSADSRGEVFALLIGRPTEPAEIYLARHATLSGLTQLSRMNAHVLDELSLSEPEECWFESSDGFNIQGWLLKPPDFDPRQKYPLLLYIHGGPDNQYGNTFFHEFQVLVARGMVVFYVNPRGSMGRGERFATSIQGNWGSVDYQDLMAAADYAASLPYVHPERMAVAGGSYGGYMAAWIVAHTDRFCCAIAERGSYNEHSGMGTSDWPPLEDGYWPGNTWDRPERLWEQSPLRYAANIHTPLLLIHSEGDWRCPIGQAEELFTALTWLKREVVFVRYPQKTNHELTWSGPPDLRVDRLHRVANWLAQHLRIEPRG
jgi:acylaminoacyl-peptidase